MKSSSEQSTPGSSKGGPCSPSNSFSGSNHQSLPEIEALHLNQNDAMKRIKEIHHEMKEIHREMKRQTEEWDRERQERDRELLAKFEELLIALQATQNLPKKIPPFVEQTEKTSQGIPLQSSEPSIVVSEKTLNLSKEQSSVVKESNHNPLEPQNDNIFGESINRKPLYRVPVGVINPTLLKELAESCKSHAELFNQFYPENLTQLDVELLVTEEPKRIEIETNAQVVWDRLVNEKGYELKDLSAKITKSIRTDVLWLGKFIDNLWTLKVQMCLPDRDLITFWMTEIQKYAKELKHPTLKHICHLINRHRWYSTDTIELIDWKRIRLIRLSIKTGCLNEKDQCDSMINEIRELMIDLNYLYLDDRPIAKIISFIDHLETWRARISLPETVQDFKSIEQVISVFQDNYDNIVKLLSSNHNWTWFYNFKSMEQSWLESRATFILTWRKELLCCIDEITMEQDSVARNLYRY